MSRIGALVRSLVPRKARTLLANCGGRNLRSSRFAGNLDAKVDDEQFLAICHSLIFPNGVRKTTLPSRNTATLQRLLDDGLLTLGTTIDVLDVGASIGIDARSTFDLLGTTTDVRSYTLGDLYGSVLYDRARGAIFDEDRRLLQVRDRVGFTSIHFSYDVASQKVVNLPKRLRPWLLERRYPFDAAAEVTRIPLVHPSLALDGDSPFRFRRVDVFEPLPPDSYDLIICMHLLVARYFSPETIAAGERNLARALRPGGTLVVGQTEAGRVWRRRGLDDFDVRDFVDGPASPGVARLRRIDDVG